MNKAKKKNKNQDKRTNNRNRKDDRYRKVDERADVRYRDVNTEAAGRNDPSWYAQNEQLLSDVGSLAFSQMLGTPFKIMKDIGYNNLWTENKVYNYESSRDYNVPGIMRLSWAPTYNIEDNVSPVNMAADNIYTYVRHVNSGSANYDAPNLMSYIIALDSIYFMIAYARQVYRVLYLYSMRNRYVPEALIKAMGMTWTGNASASLKGNIADFRARLNMCITKAQQFAVPNTMPLFQRHTWMSENLFMDSEEEKAQMYFFRPYGYFKYNETSSVNQRLRFEIIDYRENGSSEATTGITYSNLCSIIEDCLDVLIRSEDIGIMSGDILKAYGTDGIFKMNLVSENDYVQPVYNREVLEQIHNSIAVGREVLESMGIYEDVDAGILRNDIYVDVTASDRQGSTSLQSLYNLAATNRILNVHENDPSPALVMEATRLVPVVERYPINETVQRIQLTPGSEVIVEYAITTIIEGKAVHIPHYSVFEEAFSQTMANISNFDWHPLYYTIHPAAGDLATLSIHDDLDNYKVIGDQTLKNLHSVAMLSELDVRSKGYIK